MADTPQDVVNRELREFKRYTGDGLPGEPVNAPLPVGDPQSGVHNPKKVNLRKAQLATLEGADQSATDARNEADRAEGEADRSEAAANEAEGFRDEAALSEAAAKQDALDALAAKTQAELAAIAAGAPLFPSVIAGETGTTDGDVFIVSTEAGVQVYLNASGTGEMQGWLGKVAFKTVSALLAFTGPLGPVGTIITAQGFRYEVAASDATDAHVETQGGVKFYVLETQIGPTNIRSYAAVSTQSQDNTQSINYALQVGVNSEVVIPPGTWRVDGMIEVGADRTLALTGGATLRKYAATADNEEDPIVWIRGSDAVVRGAGSSTIKSDVPSPNGIVRLGHRDMTESTVNISFARLSGLRIEGMQNFGQTTGLPDKGLLMPSPQIGDLVNYFHNISDLKIFKVNVGVHLQGWANGLIIDGIYGWAIGNQGLPGDRECAFFLNDGGLDNTIENLSFHYSPNTPGLVVTDLDLRSSGGHLYESAYNSFRGLVFEQGGTGTHSVVARSGKTSFYEVRDNTNLGPSLYKGFHLSNTFFNATGVQSLNIGRSSERTYTGSGSIEITISFRQNLTGANWNNGVAEVLFHGIENGRLNEQISRYAIPVEGFSTWSIGTPVKVYGGDLTITQSDSGSNFVTFTVAGASPTQKISILATGLAQGGLAFL